MKKLSLTTFCGILILLGLSSCQKENLNGGQFTATIAQVSNDNKVVYDGTGFAWQNGDQIRVSRKKGTSFYNGYYTATAIARHTASFSYTETSSEEKDVTEDAYTGDYYAYYPATIYNNKSSNYNRVSLPAVQQVDGNGNLIGFPMYTESSNTKLEFKNLCGLLKLHLQKSSVSISKIVISSNVALNGLFNVTPVYNSNGVIDSAKLSSTGSMSDSRRSVSVEYATAQDITNGKDFFIYLPAGEYTSLKIKLIDNEGRICTKTLNSSHTFNVALSKWSRITLVDDGTVDDLPFISEEDMGVLSGLFSVASGRQVRFSKGNLQYQASTNTWQFATHQYDVCSQNANKTPSSTSANWIDMFGWGTSGYSTTDYGPSYPYNILKTDIYGPASGGFDVNGDQNFDWGYNNAISNGGNTPGMWRTLTSSEWNVIIKNRTNAANLWAAAIVNGQRGLVLLPDAWPSTGEPTYRGTASGWLSGDNINSYTVEQWRVLEQDGAVFLPLCGWRDIKSSGPSVVDWNGSNYRGRYWLSTVSTSGSPNFAHFYASNSTHTITLNYSQQQFKWHGYNVRLVCDVE